MAHTIKVDKNKCIGCGTCAALCPNSFEVKKGKANPKKAKIEEITCETDAEAACPVQAITIS